MVVDTSALLAILQDEPGRHAFNEAIQAAPARIISVASFVEASIVIEARHGAASTNAIVGGTLYDALIAESALCVGARELVTWNVRHFERVARRRLAVRAPGTGAKA